MQPTSRYQELPVQFCWLADKLKRFTASDKLGAIWDDEIVLGKRYTPVDRQAYMFQAEEQLIRVRC